MKYVIEIHFDELNRKIWDVISYIKSNLDIEDFNEEINYYTINLVKEDKED